MKTLMCIVALVCVAVAMPQGTPAAQDQAAQSQAAPAQNTVSAPQTKASAAPTANQLPAQFYGPGLNNPLALPPNQQQLQLAMDVVRGNPNVRVRVLTNGEIEFTNEFGQQVDVRTREGLRVKDLFDPEEAFEVEQERREQQFKFQQRRAEIQRQQQALTRLSQQLDTSAGAGNAANNPFSTAA